VVSFVRKEHFASTDREPSFPSWTRRKCLPFSPFTLTGPPGSHLQFWICLGTDDPPIPCWVRNSLSLDVAFQLWRWGPFSAPCLVPRAPLFFVNELCSSLFNVLSDAPPSASRHGEFFFPISFSFSPGELKEQPFVSILFLLTSSPKVTCRASP